MRGAEFAELRAFSQVAQDRSFRKAAARLGVTPSALSHIVKSLEDRLNARLLHRTTRSVSPTEAGAALLARLLPAITEIEEAVSAVGALNERPRGRLRLNLPRLAAEVILAPKLGQFASQYPEVTLDLVVEDGLADVVAGRFDAGIRSREHVHADMVAVPLTPDLRPAVVASPEYFSSTAKPKTPLDLHAHRCINYRWPDNEAAYRWHFERDGQAYDVTPDSPLTMNDTGLILSAALGGAGLAYILEDVVVPHILTGRLVRVLEDWCRPLTGFHLYFPSRKHMTTPLRAFIEFFRYPQQGGV